MSTVFTIRGEETAPEQPTSKQRWLYGLANLGCAIPYQAVGAVILFYYVDVHRLSPVWAAAVMTGYAIYNAFNNPLVGYLSDRTRTRWGRRIPYILFGTLPYALFFALLFMTPFDGVESPTALLIYFIVGLFFFETLATIVQTAYYALLPEMFRDYEARTDAAVRMNIFMTIGLLVGTALPAIFAEWLGWPLMAGLLGVLTAIALFAGLPAMFEYRQSLESEPIGFLNAIKATFVNRSFVSVVIAQTMRHFATATLAAGMTFYTKYSLGVDPGVTSAILGAAFVVAGLALWPWRKFLAQRFEARTTLMIAYGLTGVSVMTLWLAKSVAGAIAAASFVGVALAGLILMGDVILSDVVDEDEVKTGQRREGMYFGMSGLIITLAYALSSVMFGWIVTAFGYDPSLTVQPETVGMGFRVYMTIPPLVGSLLAMAALWFYPIHGQRLQEIKRKLQSGTCD
jgi:GPH family glycoside/pentoside/hexuronide:cation symporter